MSARVIPVFAAMLAESDRLGLPLSFETDLLHDQRALYSLEFNGFGWVLYDQGTHIVFPECRAPKQRAHTPVDELCETFRDTFREQHYYLGTATTLREVSFDEFQAAMVELDSRRAA